MKRIIIPAMMLGLFATTTLVSCSSPSDEQLIAIENPSKGDFDKLLDKYESYTDQYIKMSEKLKTGNIADMSDKEFETITDKASAIEKKLSASNDKLSVEQQKRFNTLQSKIASVAVPGSAQSSINVNVDIPNPDSIAVPELK